MLVAWVMPVIPQTVVIPPEDLDKLRDCIRLAHHFTLSAQNAADIGPRAMFDACRALNDLRRLKSACDSPGRFGEPETPC